MSREPFRTALDRSDWWPPLPLALPTTSLTGPLR